MVVAHLAPEYGTPEESMGSKLFVGGLSWNTSDQSLREAFERFGALREARVILDRETGKSRGFGFVTFQKDEDAQSATRQMDGAVLDGRTIRVNEAEERRPGAPGGPGGGPPRGGGGGGYGDRPRDPRGGPEVHTRGRPPGGGGGGGYGGGGGDRGGYGGGGGGGGGYGGGGGGGYGGGGGGGYGGGGGGGDRGGYGGGGPGGRPGGGFGDRGPRPGGPGGFQGGPGGRPPGPGGYGAQRPGGPGGGGFGFRAPPPPGPGEGDWGEDRTRRDRRSTKKKTTGPAGTWDEDTMRMRAAPKREKRESGKSWRDYTTDEDFDGAVGANAEAEEGDVERSVAEGQAGEE
jgi:hypothetical protein